MSAPNQPEIPPNPSTNPDPPPAPPIDPNANITKLYDEVIQEQQRKLREQEAELAKLRLAPPAPSIPTPDASSFFSEPDARIEAIVKRNMDAALAPVNASLAAQARMAAYQRIKNLIKNDARVAPFWSHIEGPLDSLAAQHTGDITVEIVATTVKNLIGQFAVEHPTEYVKLIGGAVTSTSTPPMSPTPPQIPPSAPPLPTPASPSNAPVLTENERRLAREKWPNLSAEEAMKKYAELRDPGSFVITSKEKK